MENTSTVPPGDDTTKHDETTPPVTSQESSAGAPPSSNPNPTEPSAPSSTEKQKQKQEGDEGDDESDFDELDEVLDDFSKPKPSEPSKPDPKETPQLSGDANTNPKPTEATDDAFMKQLEQDMANMMGNAAKESGTTDNEGFESAVNQGADAFTKQLEESGVPPGDFLKQLLSDVMAEEGGDKPPAAPGAADAQASGSSAAPPSGDGDGDGAPPESFNDTIQRTIHRMKESGDKATAAATDDSDDLVAQLLKAVEAGAAGGGDDGDLSKMFMGMMEQLSNKEMLYEPMKELDGKFGPWLAENRGKVAAEDMARYETQARIVSQIVGKFEEDGYTDKDAKCRDYVWERMQEMQAAGNPPDELISNPLMEDLKGPGGSPAMPDCPQQ
ncbi:hypothetical protein PHISP_08257 [Aspergillus sp. HF37]|nr:hypothetical protein PHISP_08257 [Aspergillus sp. HF37]